MKEHFNRIEIMIDGTNMTYICLSVVLLITLFVYSIDWFAQLISRTEVAKDLVLDKVSTAIGKPSK